MSNLTSEQRVTRLRHQMTRLEGKIWDAIAAAWPVGSPVSWVKNSTHPAQFGRVLSHGGERLKVLNDRTGNELWITAYDIECARRKS